MCGIVGFNWQDQKLISQLAAMLNHRGPEQEGYHVADGISLGHKRLRIIDLTDCGRQPMYNETGAVAVVFNGEIFNFNEIKTSLERTGHIFKSHSDTEVLVHGYEQWGGYELLQKLNGQFAFCIFDKQRNELFLARDRVGIKPLYYGLENGKFVFGSELKVILKSELARQIDEHALKHYMLFGYTPSERTMVSGIKKLPAGNFMIFDLTSKKISSMRPYWKLGFEPVHELSESELEKELYSRIQKAVERQLTSDVPLGAFLSGGVDSSILVAMMRPHIKDLNTFSIRFDRPEYNESAYAGIVSKMFHTIHHEIEFNAQSVRELISDLPYYYDEPFGDASMIPTCLVSRIARQHVTVCLSGTGGDELFGGYSRYFKYHVLKQLNNMPGVMKALLGSSISGLNVLLKKEGFNKLLTFFGPVQPAHLVYLQLFSYMFRDVTEDVSQLKSFDYLKEHFSYADDYANAMNFDIHEYLQNDLLVKEDRASMAVTLETRVPLLDHELIEFAARMPSNYKVRGGRKKYLLKKVFRGILPDEILYRRKQGFAVPISSYFKNELKNFVYDEIFNFELYDYYDKQHMAKLWQLNQSGKSDYSRLFWSVLMFNLWFKKWMI